MELSIIFPECSAFYSEKFCTFSKALFRECLYPKLLHNSINFIELFFSVWLFANIELRYYTGAELVLRQCCANAWHYTNVGSLLTLKSSSAPVFSDRCPSAVPTLGPLLFGSAGITLELQPEWYRVGCKDWQYTDFSAWVEKDLTSSRGKRLRQ